MGGQKRILFNVFLLSHCIGLFAQRNNTLNYWQQEVDYKIEVEMDVESAQYSGVQQITYTNHSPDTLDRVYFHLFFNAFQPGSEMDVHSRSIADPDSRVVDRIQKLKKEDQIFNCLMENTNRYITKKDLLKNYIIWKMIPTKKTILPIKLIILKSKKV